uniref:Bcl-2-like protein 1 n=2 Tax=Hirondellea gigas TaxID=1518452 RepID=A0A6A7G2Q8_9CRUS
MDADQDQTEKMETEEPVAAQSPERKVQSPERKKARICSHPTPPESEATQCQDRKVKKPCVENTNDNVEPEKERTSCEPVPSGSSASTSSSSSCVPASISGAGPVVNSGDGNRPNDNINEASVVVNQEAETDEVFADSSQSRGTTASENPNTSGSGNSRAASTTNPIASVNNPNDVASLTADDPVVQKANTLAKFIIDKIVHKSTSEPRDKVEEVLLRCVNLILTNHDILFSAMMRRLDIKKDTGYLTFVGVANELFENQKRLVTWSRIVALYAFGARLALHCKEKGYIDFARHIDVFLGRYAADMTGHYVKDNGGWEKLPEVFPGDQNPGDSMWKFLSWMAVTLGIATAAAFFSSSR